MLRLNTCQHEFRLDAQNKYVSLSNWGFPSWDSGVRDIKCQTVDATLNFNQLTSAYKGATIDYDPPSKSHKYQMFKII